MFHHFFFCTCLFLLICVFPFKKAAADYTHDSEVSREAVINSTRTKKFYDLKVPDSHLFAIGGSYDTDQNSKQYNFASRYLHQSYRFINEINFVQDTEYTDSGSGTKKRYKKKTSELYDLSLSSKTRIFDTRNYMVLYHRTAYDELSTYYYDVRNAVGFGRMFLNDSIELDLSVGEQNSKVFGNQVDLIPSIRINFKLTDKLTFNQRAYWFIDKDLSDNDVRTSLIYRFSAKTSFEVRHTFEQRRYVKNNVIFNNVRSLVTFGLVFGW